MVFVSSRSRSLSPSAGASRRLHLEHVFGFNGGASEAAFYADGGDGEVSRRPVSRHAQRIQCQAIMLTSFHRLTSHVMCISPLSAHRHTAWVDVDQLFPHL
jgi:hypothetical protein